MRTPPARPCRSALAGFLLVVPSAVASAASATTATTPATPALLQDEAQAPSFYESLAPYGEWVQLEGRGWVWVPRDVPPSWRPYTQGHWVWSDDFGWTWVSDFEWGWAPFHYGRWDFEPSYGWVWFPGTVWGPAWVVWRHDDAYFGWAPLPPAVGFGFEAGLELGGVDLDDAIQPFWWCFVPCEHFLAPHVGTVLVLQARNVTLVRECHLGEHISVIDGRVFDHGIRLEEAEHAVHHPIEHVAILDARGPRSFEARGEVHLFRPRVAASWAEGAPAPASFGRPEATRSEEEIARMKAAELERLYALHESQRRELERLHASELQRPPEGLERGALEARHRADLQELRQQQLRERTVVERRVERLGRLGGRVGGRGRR